MFSEDNILSTADLPIGAVIIGSAIFILTIIGLIIDIKFFVMRHLLRSNFLSYADEVRERPLYGRDAARSLLLIVLLFLSLHFLQDKLNVKKFYCSDYWQWSLFIINTLSLPFIVMISTASLLYSRKLSAQNMFGIALQPLSVVFRKSLLFLLGLIPIILAANILFLMFLDSIGYPIAPQEIVTVFMSQDIPLWQQIYLAIAAIIVAPIAEEILFRGICLPAAMKHMPVKDAVILVSVFFAFVHQHPESAPSLFILAAVFSIAYLHTGNLLVPIFMHSIFNASQIITILSIKDVPGIMPGN